MGAYITRAITKDEYKDIIDCIRNGYLDHKPNEQIATILILEANLGCRIGDICKMTTDSIIKDGNFYKLNITEQKTGKKRTFIVPQPIKDFIDQWIDKRNLSAHEPLFTIGEYAVWKALRQVTDFLGLENVSSHSLRKMCACNLYENTGHDIEAVREFLQHSSTAITQRYIRRSDAQLEAAITQSVMIV